MQIINKIVGMASGSPWEFIHPADSGKIKQTPMEKTFNVPRQEIGKSLLLQSTALRIIPFGEIVAESVNSSFNNEYG